MKDQRTKNKALELYSSNVPIWTISKQLNVTQKTLHDWKKSNNWDKLKQDAINKLSINVVDTVVKEQLEITRMAQEKLIERLKDDDIKTQELVNLTKHRLEVVRPKQNTNSVSITKNENTAIQIVIPKEVEELLNK